MTTTTTTINTFSFIRSPSEFQSDCFNRYSFVFQFCFRWLSFFLFHNSITQVANINVVHNNNDGHDRKFYVISPDCYRLYV